MKWAEIDVNDLLQGNDADFKEEPPHVNISLCFQFR